MYLSILDGLGPSLWCLKNFILLIIKIICWREIVTSGLSLAFGDYAVVFECGDYVSVFCSCSSFTRELYGERMFLELSFCKRSGELIGIASFSYWAANNSMVESVFDAYLIHHEDYCLFVRAREDYHYDLLMTRKDFKILLMEEITFSKCRNKTIYIV